MGFGDSGSKRIRGMIGKNEKRINELELNNILVVHCHQHFSLNVFCNLETSYCKHISLVVVVFLLVCMLLKRLNNNFPNVNKQFAFPYWTYMSPSY
jgi:hypothetical protein